MNGYTAISNKTNDFHTRHLPNGVRGTIFNLRYDRTAAQHNLLLSSCPHDAGALLIVLLP
jgi:hypothetical protein